LEIYNNKEKMAFKLNSSDILRGLVEALKFDRDFKIKELKFRISTDQYYIPEQDVAEKILDYFGADFLED
jgi:hypothetical protein